MAVVVKLLLVSFLLYFLVYAITSIKKMVKNVNRTVGANEACPACERMINVSGDNMECPECGAKLARNKEGKLLIRVN